MAAYTLACPCLFGLESVLSGEIKRMGGQDITVTDGRVMFKGDAQMVARSNIMLRTAERVMIVVGMFRAETFTELFDGVYSLPLENFIGSLDAFPVTGWAISSKLMSISDCQAIIKKASAKRLGEHYGVSWLEETGSLMQIRFSILKNMVTVMLDTSGLPLHKRGYRAHSNEAPIKETLAAGIADLAHVKPDTTVLDPFCGSGTLLIESALKALKIPPGLKRRFAAEKWGMFSEEIWRSEREAGFGNVIRRSEFQAYGSDIDAESVELCLENCKKASVASKIECKLGDIADFKPPETPFVLLSNPPYGERMLDLKKAEELYRTMGRVFVPAEGRSYCIISPHENFEQLFGRVASRRRKLYNGTLKCQLFMFF
ncbi:MAG: class I SAM-dependent RNA methyltransferase [Oscillospiraceae bacterium]